MDMEIGQFPTQVFIAADKDFEGGGHKLGVAEHVRLSLSVAGSISAALHLPLCSSSPFPQSGVR
jgi:hypothetical protein